VRSQNYSQSAVQISTTLPVDSFLYRLGPLSNRTRGCYNMAHITDDYIREMLQNSKPYTLVILRKTPKSEERGADKIVWEHGRRNFELRSDGKLCVACPVRDESDVSGIGIFSTDVNATREIMDEDPGVKAGIFVYEVHATRSFPGDALAK